MEKSINDLIEPCLICGRKTNGLHFQLSACRACASFFRRSTVEKKVYRCQRGTGDCNLSVKSKGTPLCRYCRMEMCKKLGMNIEKSIDMNKNYEAQAQVSNTISNNAETSKPNVTETDSLALSYLPSSEFPETQYLRVIVKDGEKLIIDMSGVEKRIKEILASFTRLTIITAGDKLEHLKHQEKFMIAFVKMLMYTEKFARLEFSDKLQLFKSAWTNCYQVERGYTSVLIFGTSPTDLRTMFTKNTIVDFKNLDNFQFKDINEGIYKEMFKFWIPIMNRIIQNLLAMKLLELTQFEIVFLFAQFLWDVQDIPEVSENARKVSDEILGQTANDLHNYYVYEKNLSNYAGRLIKLTKFISDIKEIQKAKGERLLLNQVFDGFKIEILGSDVNRIWSNKVSKKGIYSHRLIFENFSLNKF